MIYLISALCALSSCFYLKGIFGQSFYQPTLLCALILLLFCVNYKKLIIDDIFIYIFINILLLVCLLLTQSIFVVHQYGIINEVGRVIYPIFVCLLVLMVSKTNKFDFEFYFYTILLLLIIDSIYRLYFVNDAFIPSNSRYEIKGGGLLYADSNFTGFISGSLFFLINRYRSKIKHYFCSKFLLFLITLLSASLASYVGFAFAFLYHFFISRELFIKTVILILFILISIYITFIWGLHSNFFEDGSLKTKIQIFNYFFSFLSDGNFLDILFGVGFGNFKIYNHYPHAAHSIPGLFVDGGIFYMLLTLIFYVTSAIRKDNRAALFFMLIAGFSMYPVAYLAPIFFLLLY